MSQEEEEEEEEIEEEVPESEDDDDKDCVEIHNVKAPQGGPSETADNSSSVRYGILV